MSKTIELKHTTHDFTKTNLVTLPGKRGSYDEMRCGNCGLRGKRRRVDILEVDGRTSPNNLEKCPKVPSKAPRKVRITNFGGHSPNFTNMIGGSVHDVVEPPSDYKSKFPNSQLTVWVNGVFEPMRLLAGEFEVVEW